MARLKAGTLATLLPVALLLDVPVASAQDDDAAAAPRTGWFNETELSLLVTRGNVDSDTLGLKNKLRRHWRRARFQFRIEGARSDSGGTRTAIATDPGNPDSDSFYVFESGRVTDLDTWLVEARYDRSISGRLFWNAGTSWDKNQSAGIESRYRVFATIGHVWWARDDLEFNTSYGVSYTDRNEQIEDPTKDDRFWGVRLDMGYRNVLSKIAEYTNDTTLNVSLDDTKDWTGDMTNALTIGLSDRLAVRIGLQFLYNNRPALEVLLFCVDESQSSCPATVVTDKEPLDILFTTSLVVSF
jgi:hypothetical protein